MYLGAVREATSIFCQSVGRASKRPVPVMVHFLPMNGVYRSRSYSNVIVVKLPTPMICFETGILRRMAEWMFEKVDHRQYVLDAMLGESYQEILCEIDVLSGLIERSGGLY